MSTKTEEVYERVETMIAGGKTKAEAFVELAEHYGQPTNSIRGLYYARNRGNGGTNTPRPRARRETTPADALADARLVLERDIERVDQEVTAADERAKEAAAEHEALKKSAEPRKAEIRKRLEALA